MVAPIIHAAMESRMIAQPAILSLPGVNFMIRPRMFRSLFKEGQTGDKHQ
jgi:hypothetical protein